MLGYRRALAALILLLGIFYVVNLQERSRDMRIVISSGHGLHVPGARDIIDEVTEARKVTDRVGEILQDFGVSASVFHENTTRNRNDNVNAIVRHHNSQERGLDVSIHFNAVAGGTREVGIGVETLYRAGNTEMQKLAGLVSTGIANASDLILRHLWRDVPGTVPRTDLGFLNNTNRPAILLEVCFVNSRIDARLYEAHFERICQAIAMAISGRTLSVAPTPLSPLSLDAPQAEANARYPISESNLQAMVYRGVMQSPGHWRTINHVRWLNELLGIAAQPGRLDRRIDNGITDIETAMDVLIDADIINTPTYWMYLLRQENPVRHLEGLLINIANRSRDVLERIIHAEARGEDIIGQILVGNVILNRSNCPRFPNGIRKVVFDSSVNSQGVVLYQFTPIGNGAYARANDVSANVRYAVDSILNGADYSQGATFFRTIRGTEGSWHQTALRHLFDHGAHRFFV